MLDRTFNRTRADLIPLFAEIIVANSLSVVLAGYIDLNGDGVWSADEEVRQTVPSNEQPYSVVLSFDVVTNVTDLYGRFRLTSDMDVTAAGDAPDGEVEDYLFSSPTAVTHIPRGSNFTATPLLLLSVIVTVVTIVAIGRRYG